MPALAQTLDDCRVIHLWVDPRNGDDDLAGGGGQGQGTLNPNGPFPQTIGFGPCQPSGLRPNDIRDPNQGQAVLLHAPYPFRTVTAAVAYINALPHVPPLGPLPYVSSTQPQITWEYAIIHLLPGLYGDEAMRAAQYHPDNGLFANGETFPIRLPPRVSVQGASALSTFFDLGESNTAFRFGDVDPVSGVAITGEHTFISGITFYRGGKGLTHPSFVNGKDHAAILLDSQVPSAPVITNCMFVRNWVGVLVNAAPAPATETPEVRHDGLTLINNTFAWNEVGVWNGQGADQQQTPGIGWSKINLINNILDGLPPQDLGSGQYCNTNLGWPNNPQTWPTNRFNFTAFEGVAAEDMRIPVGAANLDFNAYERTDRGVLGVFENYNFGNPPGNRASILMALPSTAIRPGTSNPIPDPTRNIAPYTGWFTGTVPGGAVLDPRGILYVRDLFCNGRSGSNAQFQATNAGFDGSPLDFRLCPSVGPGQTSTAQFPPPNALNPLVDNGWGGSFPVTMLNGNVIQDPPGFLPLGDSQPTWAFDAQEFDCEGYANPRIHDHAAFPNRGVGLPIDIGADEVADQIVGGYRFGTTTFLQLRGGHIANKQPFLTPIDNRFQYYLGPAGATLASAIDQPKFRTYQFGGQFLPGWPNGYLAGPTAPATWHSDELTPSSQPEYRPWRFDLTAAGLVPCSPNVCGSLSYMYRATTADVTPHLLPDAHPWWSASQSPQNLIPPALTLWQPCLGTGSYNMSLYVDPLASTINPPGTYVITVPGSFAWLDGSNLYGQPATFPTFNVWEWVPGTPRRITDFDAWCRGGDTTPREHRLPDTTRLVQQTVLEPVAVRFSLEWDGNGPFGPGDKNIQSFMVLIEQQ
jgi:hypothetical protein